MAINRMRQWLTAAALCLSLTASARAQNEEPYVPYVDDVQVFAPAEFDTYGPSYIPANCGWFFTYDYLRWQVSAPDKAPIGAGGPPRVVIWTSGNQWDVPTFATQLSTIDNSLFVETMNNGFRYEFGFMNGNHGWLASAFRLYDNDQGGGTLTNVPVNFHTLLDESGYSWLQGFADNNHDGFDDDINLNAVFGRYGIDNFQNGTVPGVPPPDGLPDDRDQTAGIPPDLGDIVQLPIIFTTIVPRQHTEILGAEINYVYRLPQGRLGSNWEILTGLRYFQFDETFDIHAAGGLLANSFWNTKAKNDVVGPQVGLRWSRQTARLILSAEGRFLAGANQQRLYQDGELASLSNPNTPQDQFPPAGQSFDIRPVTFHHRQRKTEWAPLGELRLEMAYQVFSKASVSVGWTGMFIDGIARPSNMVEYQLPTMGINLAENRQEVFMQGLTLGFEINR